MTTNTTCSNDDDVVISVVDDDDDDDTSEDGDDGVDNACNCAGKVNSNAAPIAIVVFVVVLF